MLFPILLALMGSALAQDALPGRAIVIGADVGFGVATSPEVNSKGYAFTAAARLDRYHGPFFSSALFGLMWSDQPRVLIPLDVTLAFGLKRPPVDGPRAAVTLGFGGAANDAIGHVGTMIGAKWGPVSVDYFTRFGLSTAYPQTWVQHTLHVSVGYEFRDWKSIGTK